MLNKGGTSNVVAEVAVGAAGHAGGHGSWSRVSRGESLMM